MLGCVDVWIGKRPQQRVRDRRVTCEMISRRRENSIEPIRGGIGIVVRRERLERPCGVVESTARCIRGPCSLSQRQTNPQERKAILCQICFDSLSKRWRVCGRNAILTKKRPCCASF